MNQWTPKVDLVRLETCTIVEASRAEGREFVRVAASSVVDSSGMERVCATEVPTMASESVVPSDFLERSGRG